MVAYVKIPSLKQNHSYGLKFPSVITNLRIKEKTDSACFVGDKAAQEFQNSLLSLNPIITVVFLTFQLPGVIFAEGPVN